MAKQRTSKEYAAFTVLTDKLLSVSRGQLQKREDVYRQKAAQNPRKRGPKPKTTGASTSDREDA